jgi:hypothetical protein
MVARVGVADATLGWVEEGDGETGTSVAEALVGDAKGLTREGVHVARGAGVGVEVGSEVAQAVVKTPSAITSRTIFFTQYSLEG